ncbi:MAG: aminopeptidase [Thermoanaerobaculia bacterium]|nr:aminopeptidase [Thermoanaerobaculia bacterium]
MMDPRIERLAATLIQHSVRLKEGEHLLIEGFDIPDQAIIALVREARRVGGHPHVAMRHGRIQRALLESADDEALKVWADYDVHRMERMNAYLGLRGSDNISEMAGAPEDRVKAYSRLYARPVHFEERVKKTRWCILRWPSPSMAQLAEMSTDAFEEFYFQVCTLDYGRMARATEFLKERMERTDQVHILGPGDTDLRFSIQGIPAVPCCGEMNIPDGECFTAPVRDSVQGILHYNTPTIYHGESFANVRLEFVDGKIVDATADQNGDKLAAIFDSDEGARYVGEFSIAYNPYIREAMKDILFDEKIAGSLHFTPGQAYDEADNGNRSEIHWDMVLIQRSEYGGGTISFDGEVIRRDGLFVVDDLLGLNPDALTAE